MSNQDITRLVVGESITLAMGVPVGQEHGTSEVSDTLRWRDGRWESNAGVLDLVKKSLSGSETVLKLPAGTMSRPDVLKWLRLLRRVAVGLPPGFVAAFAGLVLAVAALVGIWMHKKGPSDDFAVVPDARTGAATTTVKTVDEPWIRAAPEQSSSAPSAQPTVAAIPVAPAEAAIAVPVVPGSLLGSELPVAEKQIDAPRRPTVPAPSQDLGKGRKPPEAKATEASDADKKAPPPVAVILDEDPKSAATKAKDTPGPQVVNVKQAAKDVQKRSIGGGLVAVTPDGKSALFTSATTRLPEKFGVGEKLPSGEIVKSIDVTTGVVKTDAKEYRLE